jgi:hypothetical protein
VAISRRGAISIDAYGWYKMPTLMLHGTPNSYFRLTPFGLRVLFGEADWE